MPVYVDDMRARYGRLKMCHMIGTPEDELHAMADRIGVARKWYQDDHYDVCLAKRALAVKAGAVEITWRQAARMVCCLRWGIVESLPAPEDAEGILHEWMVLKRICAGEDDG